MHPLRPVHQGKYSISHCIDLHYNSFSKRETASTEAYIKRFAEETFLCSTVRQSGEQNIRFAYVYNNSLYITQ